MMTDANAKQSKAIMTIQAGEEFRFWGKFLLGEKPREGTIEWVKAAEPYDRDAPCLFEWEIYSYEGYSMRYGPYKTVVVEITKLPEFGDFSKYQCTDDGIDVTANLGQHTVRVGDLIRVNFP